MLAELHEEDGQAGVGVDGRAEVLDQVWVTQATQAGNLLVETSHQPLHHPRSPRPPPPLNPFLPPFSLLSVSVSSKRLGFISLPAQGSWSQ